jgi:hypothetical protein
MRDNDSSSACPGAISYRTTNRLEASGRAYAEDKQKDVVWRQLQSYDLISGRKNRIGVLG